MLFNSLGFLAFFSVLVPVHYALPHRFRWVLLLAASVYFYLSLSGNYVWLLAVVALAAYVWGVVLETARRRALLAAALVTILGPLVVFKYYDFLIDSLEQLLGWAGVSQGTPILPRLELGAAAGLSFFTLSSVSYVADVARGHLRAVRHPGHLFLYVAFFPKLLAGPIERATPFLEQVRTPAAFSAERVAGGLQLMLWGLFKKVVIADGLAAFVDAAYALPTFAPPADLVIATYFFAFQLYCDFSGYSDIAIGASRVLGIDLMENFRRPYFSTSVPEFWSARWHLSLAAWFRDYLYIPIGGGRVSPLRRAANVMTVFLVSGLWHGANWTFVCWGGLNGLYTVIWQALEFNRGSAPDPGSVARSSGSLRLIQQAMTFHLILISWVFFRAASVGDASAILSRTIGAPRGLPTLLVRRLGDSQVLTLIAFVALVLIVEALDERRPLWERVNAQPVAVRWTLYYAMAFGLLVFGTWNLRQFVYMQF